MKQLKLDQMQSYFDENTSEPLALWMGLHSIHVDGMLVELDGVPLLKNEKTGDIHFPDKTKNVINFFVKEAKEEGKPVVLLRPNTLIDKRYHYGVEFNFLYSWIDYECIPGLMRIQNDGFLTPLFFNLSTLNKYSQNPDYKLDLFSETYGTIRCCGEWSIEFGINKNKKLVMWLGDVDALPDNEKYYLRSENIQSDHDIHSEFYDAQIEVQWSELSRQSLLFHLRSNLKDGVFERQKFELYSLDGEISAVIENLNRPVFWEDRHVAPVIQSLNKIFVESLDSKALKKEIASKAPGVDLKAKGSLKLFEMWLNVYLQASDVARLMKPFYVLYDFRIVTSHLHSEQSSNSTLAFINSRLGLKEDNGNYETIYDALIESLADSYREIIAGLKLSAV